MKLRSNKHLLWLFFLFAIVFTLGEAETVMAAGTDIPPEVAAMVEKYGVFTLVPPLLAIVLAFITKNVIFSLFLGVLSGTFMLELNGANVFAALGKGFLLLIGKALASLADPWDAGIILQVMAIGGVIALITRMGGAKAIAEALAKRATTPRSSQIVTWLMGLIIFFDDYANSLIVGPIMRPVNDALRISREKLAFIIDATAAPIAGIALISTWVGYEIGVIKDAFDSIGMTVNAYALFVQTIPYRFYNILLLAFVVLSALMLRDFGPMLKAERRARETGKVMADDAKPMISVETTALEPAPGAKLNIWNALIPLLVLIIGAVGGFYYNGYNAIMAGEDKALINLLTAAPLSFKAIQEAFGNADASVVLFQAAILAGIVAIIMGVWQKIFSLGEAIDTWVQGIKSMVITGVILLLAWSISSVIKDLGTAHWLTNALKDSIPAFILPTVIFVLGAVISFATGTSYGTMGILMPLAVPLAYALSPDMGYMIVCTSAVLTGAIFGDHCSPISDTTILSSMGAACDHIAHVNTQLWYAITVALVTIIFGYIPAGLGLSIWLVLPISILVIALVIRFIGKPVEAVE
ncbi:Na+/H+ antiporter NhaC family protein [Thermosyntropha sp.]|uniref:Na+/H+ antiporter NhaC family protein n=1 Tax=Thermosyntropha sp. TaxID=2740820 RepID=UPI0025F08236|nr:Na+/H+ antiporter NhaC family protein [Thermosyntropha sp.]MBO8158961.1 Na+/H+ antiporter NhaC family protein [Thermosyntropha sp.]